MTVTCYKPGSRTTNLFAHTVALAVWVLAAGAGCGAKPPQQSASAPAPEIRGEPIRPAEPPVPAAPVSPAATTLPPAIPSDAAPNTPPTPPQEPPAPRPDSTRPAPAAPVTEPATAAHSAAAVPAGNGTADSPLVVGFDRLASFKYDVPDGPASTNSLETATFTSQIPKDIRALDKQFVALKGFMLPLKVESGLVTEMLIMRDQSMCCFGTVPKINEWVSVKMSGKGVKPVMDQAVTMHGRLHVGEIRENGYLVGIYQMDGDRVIGPLDL